MPHSAEKTYVKNVLAYSAPPRTAGTHPRQPANEEPQVKLTLRVVDENFARGTFGLVYEGCLLPQEEKVAIKKVLQDPQYRNRELEIIRELNHRNVVDLKFYYHEVIRGEKFLYLIMEHMPDSLNRVIRRLNNHKRYTPMIYVRVIMFQLFRALAYIHSLSICHRDIKPQNILIDPRTAVTKLCDFGSSKQLVTGESNVAYICSRFYRSPDLILGREKYRFEVDIWAAGCVMGELLDNSVLFLGENRADQIAQIISVLGTPTTEEMQAMNPNYGDLALPDLPKRDWATIFHRSVPVEAFTLINGLLRYAPLERLTAFEALSEDFFTPLRDPNLKLPGDENMPILFDWTRQEMLAMPSELRDWLVHGPVASQGPQRAP